MFVNFVFEPGQLEAAVERSANMSADSSYAKLQKRNNKSILNKGKVKVTSASFPGWGYDKVSCQNQKNLLL